MKENKIICSECGANVTNLIKKQLKEFEKEKDKLQKTIIDLDKRISQEIFNKTEQIERISELESLLEIAQKENLELQNKIKNEEKKERKIDEILKAVKDLRIKF